MGTFVVVVVVVVAVVVVLLFWCFRIGSFQFPSKSNKTLSQPQVKDPPTKKQPPLLGGRFVSKVGSQLGTSRYRPGKKHTIWQRIYFYFFTNLNCNFKWKKQKINPSQFFFVLGHEFLYLSPSYFLWVGVFFSLSSLLTKEIPPCRSLPSTF